MNTFEVNGTTYQAKPFDFNLICDLEDMGISIEEMDTKRMSMIRAYFAICAGKDSKFAGSELNAHFVGGGKLNCIAEAMSKEMDISDFFQALFKKPEKEIATNETAENKEESKK